MSCSTCSIFSRSGSALCEKAGIPKAKLVADPGIGFGKHLPHNVAVLSAMSLYHGLGVPVLLGASRKKLIGQLCNVDAPKDRVPGSIAAALSAIAQGVQIVRVHDVAATRQAVAVWQAAMHGTEEGLAVAWRPRCSSSSTRSSPSVSKATGAVASAGCGNGDSPSGSCRWQRRMRSSCNAVCGYMGRAAQTSVYWRALVRSTLSG